LAWRYGEPLSAVTVERFGASETLCTNKHVGKAITVKVTAAAETSSIGQLNVENVTFLPPSIGSEQSST
jgi:hypothetical protein